MTIPISTIISDVQLIAGGVQSTVSTLAFLPGINPTMLTNVNTALGALQTTLAALQTATTATAAQPLLQQIDAAINAIVGAVAGIPGLPFEVTLALDAASILLPIIEAAVNQVITPTPATARKSLSVL